VQVVGFGAEFHQQDEGGVLSQVVEVQRLPIGGEEAAGDAEAFARGGQRLVSIPYSLEVNDVPLFVMRNTPPERYAALCKAQFDALYEEGAESGTVMCLPIHPYLVGQPHRIAAFEEVLRHVAGHEGVWLATGREIARHYIDNHLAAHEAWIAEGTP